MSILKLTSAYKDYLWGGTILKENYDKNTDLAIVAESWELSTHPDGPSKIASGKYQGMTLKSYIKQNGTTILGSACDRFKEFPVLIKFIDALDALSIQVHPNDEYAQRVEKEYGKTEMWVVLEAKENAFLYFGVKEEMDQKTFRERIENETLTDYLQKVIVHKGDVFFIEAGTIHAIGAGIVICEVQQNSNTTYRVFDYGRKGVDGKLRDLHIDKAVEVSCLKPTAKICEPAVISSSQACSVEKLVACPYFTTLRYHIHDAYSVASRKESFQAIVCLDGSGTIACKDNTFNIKKGDTFFVEANSGEVYLKGNMECLNTFVE